MKPSGSKPEINAVPRELAEKKKQIARLVDPNLAIQRAESERARLREGLQVLSLPGQDGTSPRHTRAESKEL